MSAQPVELPKKLQRLDTAIEDKLERTRVQSATLLFTLLNHHCILPPLFEHDKLLNKRGKHASKRKTTITDVEARTILRGAAMNLLVTASGGDESILASTGAYSFLTSPFTYLRISQSDRADRAAASIMKGADQTIPAFTQALTTLFSSCKTILPSLKEHAQLIREQVFGSSVSGTISPKLRRLQQGKGSMIRKLKDCTNTSIKDIFPSGVPISLLPVVSILREACNRSRQLPAADKALYTILCGQVSGKGQPYPPEQTNPIRGNSEYTQLFLQILPPTKLTKPEGISALLAYMGTGQCTATQSFLSDNPEVFWAHQSCVSAFETAKLGNDIVYNTNPAIKRAKAAGKKTKKFIVGMVRYEFPQVWGQPCCHLSVKDGVKERFAPMFDPAVQSRWAEWLGPLLGKNPAEIPPGEKHSWKGALDFVQGLGIKGFTRGLTSLQFANNLWVAGIVADPSIPEMVDWLYVNRDLGATKGLEHLGFKPVTFKGFYAAFLAVHEHLNEYLSVEDKQILHFSVIFVEHLLCKISRWGRRLGSHAELSTEVGGGEWSQGRNKANHLAFPAPEMMDVECLKKAVEKANVCILPQATHAILTVE